MPQSPSTTKLDPGPWVLAAIIIAAVATRLLYHFNPGLVPPNFSPVEAVALFGGAYFADRRLALLVPLAAMAMADLVIGFHGLLWLVYACIALSTLLGFGLRGKATALWVAGFGVAGSTLFYLVTNFAVWWGSSMYPQTVAGLVESYVAGIPFYRNMVAGTLFYSLLMFGGFALMRARLPQLRAQTV